MQCPQVIRSVGSLFLRVLKKSVDKPQDWTDNRVTERVL